MEPEDPRERRDPEERERALMKTLPAVVAHAFARAPAYRRRDPAVVPEEVTDRRALARLPLVRKSELAELQRGDPPFGGFSAVAAPQAARLFASPGGLYELEPRRLDPWRAARALRAAGFHAGDVVHNSFSYHLTPAASMVETAAHALGCAVIPAGTAPTEAQVAAAGAVPGHRLRGDALLPQGPPRPGGRAGRRPVLAHPGLGDGGGAPERAPQGARRARSSGPAMVRDRGRRAHRVRDCRRWRGWSSTRRSSWKSSGPAPETRCRRARWGRWW